MVGAARTKDVVTAALGDLDDSPSKPTVTPPRSGMTPNAWRPVTASPATSSDSPGARSTAGPSGPSTRLPGQTVDGRRR